LDISLEHIIETYGYIALVIGTFLEGETILVLGGVAAKLGYLKLPWVILSAFAGSLCGDQLLFFLGRYQGQWILQKIPTWKRRADKVHRVLERHRIPIILGFRFVYGFRTITPLVLGMSRVPIIEFVVLNIISAALWATTFGSLGYIFGKGLELILGDIRHYEMEILGFLLVTAMGIGLTRFVINRRQRKNITPHD
jgi:membrane protein DedA with SNARE-associated domain